MSLVFLLLNILFIPYYISPYVFHHNIILNITSTLYWYNYPSHSILLYADKFAIAYGMYKSFILSIHIGVYFTMFSLSLAITGFYFYNLSNTIKEWSILGHSIFHILYHMVNYSMLYIVYSPSTSFNFATIS